MVRHIDVEIWRPGTKRGLATRRAPKGDHNWHLLQVHRHRMLDRKASCSNLPAPLPLQPGLPIVNYGETFRRVENNDRKRYQPTELSVSHRKVGITNFTGSSIGGQLFFIVSIHRSKTFFREINRDKTSAFPFVQGCLELELILVSFFNRLSHTYSSCRQGNGCQWHWTKCLTFLGRESTIYGMENYSWDSGAWKWDIRSLKQVRLDKLWMLWS